MGKNCCVPKCRSQTGIKNGSESIKSSMHVFPSDPDLRSAWIRNVGRPNWEPTPNSTICSLHFEENNYLVASQDKNESRKKKNNGQLQRKTLRPDAVPTLFSDMPKGIQRSLDENHSESEEIVDTQEISVDPILSENDEGEIEESIVKVENSFSNNPWCVDDASVFLKFCCPECDYQIPDLQMFHNHAIGNHTKATVLFGFEKSKKQIHIKEEQFELETNEISYDDYEDMQTDAFTSYQQSYHQEEFLPSEYLTPYHGNDVKMENPLIIKQEIFDDDFSDQHKSKLLQSLLREKVKKSTPKKIALEKTICEICDFECGDIEKLNEHQVEKHQVGKHKRCSYCDFKSMGWLKLKCHIDGKHPEHGKKKHSCNLCGKGFIFKESCQTHKQTNHYEEIEKHKMAIKESKNLVKFGKFCDFCNLEFENTEAFKEHQQQKHEDGKFKVCQYCDKKLYHWLGLKCHIDRKHPEHGEKVHLCDFCGKGFIFEDSCKSHKRTQHQITNREKEKRRLAKQGNSNANAVCDICNLDCESLDGLVNHKLTHQDGDFKLCLYCDYRHTAWGLLRVHLDRKHPKHCEKKYFCDKCEKGFKFKVTFQKHNREVHPIESQELVCHVCGFSTMRKRIMSVHFARKHDPEKQKKCPHCDFQTARTSGLDIHIDGYHAELYAKHFECYHCSRGFIFQASLAAHLSKLQTRKQLVCKFCSCQVSKIQEFTNHVMEIHPEIKQNSSKYREPLMDPKPLPLDIKNSQRLVCDLCNAECECLQTLKKHKLEKHQDGKLKCCFYCDYKNLAMENLKSHIDSNHPEHGKKPHLCDLCGKDFFYQSSVKRHKAQNHQKETCHVCGKQLFNKDSLKSHLSAAHKIGEELTFSCQFCPFITHAKGSLKSHIAAKHKIENHKKCPYCEYHTHSLYRIQVHLDGKHPEHDEKHFSCHHCSRRFIYENSLKHHLENIKNGPKRQKRK